MAVWRISVLKSDERKRKSAVLVFLEFFVSKNSALRSISTLKRTARETVVSSADELLVTSYEYLHENK